jgi:hypothetical protein
MGEGDNRAMVGGLGAGGAFVWGDPGNGVAGVKRVLLVRRKRHRGVCRNPLRSHGPGSIV